MKFLAQFAAFILCAMVPVCVSSISVDTGKEMMLRDLEIIKSVFDTKYAPADWKKEYTNWGLNEQIEIARQKVLSNSNLTVKDFQRVLLDFFNSTKDYHVNVSFFSTEFALLPIRIQSAEGRYFITWIDPILGTSNNGLKTGDEIIKFDGKPIEQVVQQFKLENFGNPDSATDQSLAEAHLTLRVGIFGHHIPSGPIDITVRNTKNNRLQNYTMWWFYNPEKVKNNFIQSQKKYFAAADIPKIPTPSAPSSLININMISPHYKLDRKVMQLIEEELLTKVQTGDNYSEDDGYGLRLGNKKSYIPSLGPILWEAPAYVPYQAYLFEGPDGKKIGYVRIPSYNGSYFDVLRFGEIIEYFEKNSDALVIDQVNNPGGNLFYMYALTSMLTDKPLKTPKDRLRITQLEVFYAIQSIDDLERVRSDEDATEILGPTLWGFPVNYTFAKEALTYFRFILNEWNDGRTFSDLIHPYGIEFLKPHTRSRYSKPVLLLVNSLDFSCADYFPAMLQDNKRVLVIGTATAGAGGSVLEHTYPNLFGVSSFSYTTSISERENKQPIENLGVTPDIELPLTIRDLQEGYVDYIEGIYSALRTLLKKK